MTRSTHSIREARRQKKQHPKKRAPDVVHQLDQGMPMASGCPDDDELRCGADIYNALMTLNARLVTCPKCLSALYGSSAE